MYKKEAKRILSGGVNWLPPSDIIPDTDCLDASNFRSDTAGGIRSRAGSTTDGTAGSNPIRSLITAVGHQYQGSDAFYRDYSSVDTGYDGERMGLVDWKSRVWIMNRSRQRKDTGSANYAWAITAPAAKCVAADGSEVSETVSNFDNSETWTVDPTGDDSFDGTEKKEGTHSLLIECPEDRTYTLTRTVSADLSDYAGTAAGDNDKHRIWMYASKWKKIQRITFKVDVSSTGGDFTQYYIAQYPRKKLLQAGKGWFRFEIRKQIVLGDDGTAIDSTPYFERIGGDTARNWSTVTALQIILDTRAAVDVRFDLWDVFGSVNADIEGQDIQYYFTYADDNEQESNPSPISDPITINHTGVALSSLTASADAQVTKKYIYRTGGSLTKIYRVSNTGVANATTTYTDTNSTTAVAALGIELQIDRDAPPAARGAIGPYFGRIIVFNSSSHKNRIWWSKLNEPWAFPGAASELTGNWADIGDTNEEIVGATMRPNLIVFYKQSSIWRLTGDPDDITGVTQPTLSMIGVIGYGAVLKAGIMDYFQSKEGIYRFAGDGDPDKISQKIDGIFKGQTVTLATGITIAPISTTNQGRAVLGMVNNDRLYFSYPSTGQTNPDVTLIYDIPSGRWFRHSLGFCSFYYEGTAGDFLGGRSNGVVLNLETGTDDSGSAIPVIYHSRDHDMGFPDLEKTNEDLTIDHNTGGATITATAYLNDGATAVSLGTFSSSARTRTVLSFNSGAGSVGRTTAIRLTGNAGASPVQIYDMVLNYYLEARQAKSFDTDEQALGNGKMTKVRELLLDLENSSTVTWTEYSDQPSFAMASRATSTIAAGTTRRQWPVMISSEPRGFLHRTVLSGSDFRLYGIKKRVQVYGEYLIGARSEIYRSDPLDWGSERVKLAKELSFDIDLSGGTCQYTLETELPGGALASRATGTISVTSGESTVKIRLPNVIKGRLFRLTLTPSATAELAIFALRIWLKQLGLPNAGPWDWMPFPVPDTVDGIWVDIPLPVDEQTA